MAAPPDRASNRSGREKSAVGLTTARTRAASLRRTLRNRPAGRQAGEEKSGAGGRQGRHDPGAKSAPHYLKTFDGASRLSEPSNAIGLRPSAAIAFSSVRVCAIRASTAAWTIALPFGFFAPIIWS